MRITRRKVTIGLSLGSVSNLLTATTWAEGSEDAFAQELPIGGLADFEGTPESIRNFGLNPAAPEEEKKANEIMKKAASLSRPYDMANYFLNLSAGDERYKGGWPDRWNPVIRGFFQATKTIPAGDLTPWCAAFVNWCLMNAKYEHTDSAASGSFKTLAKATQNPAPGDIVVFRRSDPSEAALLKGHVAFYVESRPNAIRVLGGNQITRAGHHEISLVWFKKNSDYLTFDSYRTVSK